jgi:hypothetical protein
VLIALDKPFFFEYVDEERKAQRVKIPEWHAFVFRSDLVHRGGANPTDDCIHRLFMYICHSMEQMPNGEFFRVVNVEEIITEDLDGLTDTEDCTIALTASEMHIDTNKK